MADKPDDEWTEDEIAILKECGIEPGCSPGAIARAVRMLILDRAACNALIHQFIKDVSEDTDGDDLASRMH